MFVYQFRHRTGSLRGIKKNCNIFHLFVVFCLLHLHILDNMAFDMSLLAKVRQTENSSKTGNY